MLPRYDCVGIHSGVPPDLALPAEARQARNPGLAKALPTYLYFYPNMTSAEWWCPFCLEEHGFSWVL